MTSVFVLLCLVSFCLCAPVSNPLDSALDTEVDGYLKWYDKKIRVKVPVGTVSYGVNLGHLWWRKRATVKCSDGVVYLTEAELERRSPATSINTDSSPWVSVSLGFLKPAPILFPSCTYTEDKPSSTPTSFSLSGAVVFVAAAVDFQFTYKSYFRWWCTLDTISLTLKPQNMRVEYFTDQFKTLDESIVNKFSEIIVKRISTNVVPKLNIGRDGPMCSKEKCQ